MNEVENARERARSMSARISQGFEGWHSLTRIDDGRATWALCNAFVFALGDAEAELVDSRPINEETNEIEVVAVTAQHVFKFAGILGKETPILTVAPRDKLVALEILEAPEVIESNNWNRRPQSIRMRLTYPGGFQVNIPVSQRSDWQVADRAAELYPAFLQDLTA